MDPKTFIKYCENNELERVKDCLSRGVDVSAVSEDGYWSSLTLAARQNNTDLLELFLSHPHIKINLAVDAGGVEADWAGYQWTALVFAQLDLNCEDLHGNTAGHRAVMWSEGQPDLVRILADTGRLD